MRSVRKIGKFSLYSGSQGSVRQVILGSRNNLALGWGVFGVDDLRPEDQIAKAYKTLAGMLTVVSKAQATSKVASFLLLDGETSQVVSLGGYKITLKELRATEATAAAPTLLAGGVSYEFRAMANDVRPFRLILNTAADEFTFVGSNLNPSVVLEEPNPAIVQIGLIEEGSYVNGAWPRLNGDEGPPVLGPMESVGGPKTFSAVRVRLCRTATSKRSSGSFDPSLGAINLSGRHRKAVILTLPLRLKRARRDLGEL